MGARFLTYSENHNMLTTELDLTADTIDVRDIIARVEELDEIFADCPDNLTAEQGAELAELRAILDQLKGYGGDEEWRGDWYPTMLIADFAFEDHARELLEDCGTIPKDLPWYVAIDWETTAQHIQGDYTSVDVGSTVYWYR